MASGSGAERTGGISSIVFVFFVMNHMRRTCSRRGYYIIDGLSGRRPGIFSFGRVEMRENGCN
jgi:hypothetical protein